MQRPRQASLLGIPAELRLKIYECVLEEDTRVVKLYGRADGQINIAKARNGPLALLEVCKLIRHETIPFKPAISGLEFDLNNFTLHDAVAWLHHMGERNVAQIRKLRITVHGGCYWGGETWRNGHYAYCSWQKGKRCSDHCERFLQSAKDIKMTYGLCQRMLAIDLGDLNASMNLLDPTIGTRRYWNRRFQAKACERKLGGVVGESWGDHFGRCASAPLHAAVMRLPHPCDALSISAVLAMFKSMLHDHSKWNAQQSWNTRMGSGAAMPIVTRELNHDLQAIDLLPDGSKLDYNDFLAQHIYFGYPMNNFIDEEDDPADDPFF